MAGARKSTSGARKSTSGSRSRSSSGSSSRAKAAPAKPPARKADAKPQSRLEAEQERREAQPHVVSGPGSGTTLRKAPDGKGRMPEVSDVLELADPAGDPFVVIGEDVYEDVLAPGTKDRYIQRLLFPKGKQVRRSVLERHRNEQRKRAEAAEAEGK